MLHLNDLGKLVNIFVVWLDSAPFFGSGSIKQESRADAGVSVQQSRHLVINYELGFSTAIEALTCAANWRKHKFRTPTRLARFPNPPSFDAPTRGDPVRISG